MSESEVGGRSSPTIQIHEAHKNAHLAIDDWISVITENHGEEFRKQAHKNLHRFTIQYFQKLKYLLKTKDSVNNFWEGNPPTMPKSDKKDIPDLTDGEGYLYTNSEMLRVPKYEKDEQVIEFIEKEIESNLPDYITIHHCTYLKEVNNFYVYGVEVPIFGLKKLEGQWKREVVEQKQKSDMLGIRTETVKETKLLDPETLMNAITALDEAAEKLGLLAEVDDSVPRTEITKEMIEESEQWRKQNLE